MKDLSGQRFGQLSVIQPTSERRCGEIVWECKCDCGKTALVTGSALRRGGTKSCGCLKTKSSARTGALMRIEITGQRFGRLTALHPTAERANGSVVWECRCDCGNTVFTQANKLSSHQILSCGCLQRDLIRNTGKKRAADIKGQKFGLLTAVRPTEKRAHRSIVWECVCDCGATTFSTPHDLRAGDKKSCGCLRNMSKRNQSRKP